MSVSLSLTRVAVAAATMVTLAIGAPPALAADDPAVPLSADARPLHDGGAALAVPDGDDAPSAARAAEVYYNALVGGETLNAGEYIYSENDLFTFVMQSDGNAVVYNNATGAPTWTTWTAGTGDHFTFQADGNAVVYRADGGADWWSGSFDEPGATLIIQDDGNLVIYREDGSPAWASSVNGVIQPPATPDLYSGQSLRANRELTSPDARFRAAMQGDGNFVVYGPSGVQWHAGTSGAGNHLEMQSDGNAVIYSASGAVKWFSGTAGNPGAAMTMLNDGRLLIVSTDGDILWNSRAEAKRDTMGPSEILWQGEQLTSANGRWRLVVQDDGNVVVYGPQGPNWSTGTSGVGNRLLQGPDGQLWVSAYGNSTPQWSAFSKTYFGIGQPYATAPHRLVMQNDGNLVPYDALGRPTWASRGGV